MEKYFYSKKKEEVVYQKAKGIDNLKRSFHKKTSKKYGNEFIEKLRSSKAAPRVFNNALKKIVNNYLNKSNNILRIYIRKWKEIILKIEINELKSKYLTSIGNRNDHNNRKSRLGRTIRKWLLNTKEKEIITKVTEFTLKDNNKNVAALLIKVLKRVNLKNDRDYILRKAIRNWLKHLGKIDKKYNDSIKDAIKHILRANILKNGRDFLHKNKGKIVIISKKKEIKNLLPYRRRYELLILLHYLLLWRQKSIENKNSSNNKEIRKNYIKNILKKQDKENLIRALYKWKSNIKVKGSNIPLIHGIKNLIKALTKKPFDKLKRTPSKKPVDMKSGITVTQALMKGDVNSARIIALRKIFLMDYLNKWRRNIKEEMRMEKEEESKENKYNIFKKVFIGPLLKISKKPLKKYFDKWRDKVRDITNNNNQRIIYMKLIKNMYNNISKNTIRKGLNKWREATKKVNKDLNDSEKAMDLLRKVITQPIFETFRTKITEIEKIKTIKTEGGKKLKTLLKHFFITNKKTDLSKYLNRWRKALDNVKEKKIKTSLLVNVAKHQDRKDKDKALNRLREVLLKWRINIAPTDNETLDKVKDIREGVDILHSTLKKPHNENIFKEIKERKKSVGAPKVLNKILGRIIPKANNNILRRYLYRWRDTLTENIRKSFIVKKKVNRLVDKLLNNPDVINKLKKKLKLPDVNPYKELPNILKEIHKAKNDKANILINFFKRIKPKKIGKVENRDKVLKKYIMKKQEPQTLRNYFIKWYRISNKKKLNEASDKIKDFLMKKVKKVVNTKKTKYDDFIKLIRKYILKKVFERFTDEGKNKEKYDILRKIIKRNDQPDKKRLKDAFLKWRRLIPKLKKNDSVTKIQSVLRGMKTRKTINKQEQSSKSLKSIYDKKETHKNDLVRVYLLKWLINAKRKTMDKNVKKIQKYLKIKVVTNIKITKENTRIKDLFRRLLLKLILKNLKNITKSNKDTKNFDDIFKILTKIILTRAFDKLLKNADKHSKENKLKKVIPKVKESQKKHYVPKYLKRWKTYSIDKRDDNAKKIQDFIKNNVHEKAVSKNKKNKEKVDTNLKKYIIKKSDNKDDKIRRTLKKWFANSRRITLNEGAKKIQKFLHRNFTKKQEIKKEGYDKLKKLFMKYILKYIGNTLKNANTKSKNLKKALEKIPGIDQKFLDTNNLIKIGKDTIRKQVLTHLIKNIKRKDVNDILRKFLLRWKENKDKYLLKVKVLQNFFRKTLALKKELTLKKLNFILLSIFNKNDYNMKEILRSTFRKWQLRNQLGKCNDSSMIIQEFILPRIFKVLHIKINRFFVNLAKKIVKRRLNDLGKFRKLKNTLIKVYLKKVVKTTNDVHKNKIINTTLKKTIETKNKKEREDNLRNYLLKWNKNAKDLTDKLNDSATKIQKYFRSHKVKKEVEQKKDSLDKFKNTILGLSGVLNKVGNKFGPFDPNNPNNIYDEENGPGGIFGRRGERGNPLRVYFWRWVNNSKKNTANDKSNIIKNFLKKIKKIIVVKKDDKNKENISNGVDILNKYNPNKKYAFDLLKKYVKMIILNSVLNKLNDNRKNNINDFINKLKDNAKDDKLNKLLNVNNDIWKRLILNAIKKWQTKADKIKKDEEKKLDDQKKEDEKNQKKTTTLKKVIYKKNNNNNNNLGMALKIWRRNIKTQQLENASDKIKKYLKKKINDLRARNNWRKLVKLLRRKNHINNEPADVLRKYTIKNGLDKVHNVIRRNSRKNTLTDIQKKTNFINTIKTLDNLFDKVNDKTNNFLLRHYLNKWKNKKDRSNLKEKSIDKLVDVLDKINKIKSINIINSAFLLKKFLHDLPYIRAIDFINRLKKIYELKKKISVLGDTLIKTKKDLDDKNKEKFIKQLYKLYVQRALDKLINKIKELEDTKKTNQGKIFLNLLKRKHLKDLESITQSTKEGGQKSNPTKFKFKAHITHPKDKLLDDDIDRENYKNLVLRYKPLDKLKEKSIDKSTEKSRDKQPKDKLKDKQSKDKLKEPKNKKNTSGISYDVEEESVFKSEEEEENIDDNEYEEIENSYDRNLKRDKEKKKKPIIRKPITYIIPLFIEYLKRKIKERRKETFDKIKNIEKYDKFIKYIKEHINKKLKNPKEDFLNNLKNIQHILQTKGPLLNKLYKLLRKYIIKKWVTELHPISRVYKLFYLFKLTFMFKGVTENRFIREIIRKWRFISFAKIMAKRKLELMYKNLHVSYLQMANEFFGEEETTNTSVLKEFERFGTDIGMWSNESPEKLAEAGYCKKVNRKYIFDPIKVKNVEGLYPEVQKLYTEEFNLDGNKHLKGKGRIIKEKIEVDDDNNIIIDNDNDNKIYMESEEKGNLSGKKIRKGKKSKIEDKDNIYDDNNNEIYIEGEGKSNLSGSGKKYKSHQIDDDEDIKEGSFSKGSFKDESFKDNKVKEGNLENENLEFSKESNPEERKDEEEKESKGRHKFK